MTGGAATAIAGVGLTDVGTVYGRTGAQFAAQAVRLAAADAGVALDEIDGLLLSGGVSQSVGLELQSQLGLTDLSLLTFMQGYGSTAAQMVQYASLALQAGTAETIAVVWADAPLRENTPTSAAYTSDSAVPTGFPGLRAASGISTTNTLYALAARRHMARFGTTQDQFGHIAVAQREWAMINPLAQMRTALTLDEYHASRYIAEPFHLFDCCLVSNGGAALIVTSLERARDLRRPPVRVLGWAQAHPGHAGVRDDDFGLVTGAASSGPRALAMAGVELSDIDLVELYDCYTYTALVTLEDYGFCGKGEGSAFVSEAGMLGPNGRLKVNTGGGQLSSYYLWGMTPLTEAIYQARGEAGERQVVNHDLVLVSGNGGVLDHHSTLVLGTD